MIVAAAGCSIATVFAAARRLSSALVSKTNLSVAAQMLVEQCDGNCTADRVAHRTQRPDCAKVADSAAPVADNAVAAAADDDESVAAAAEQKIGSFD